MEPKHTLASRTNHTQPLATVTSMHCVIKYWLDSTYLIKIAPSFVTCRLHTYATDTRAKSNMEDPFIINSNRNIIMRISKRTHKHT